MIVFNFVLVVVSRFMIKVNILKVLIIRGFLFLEMDFCVVFLE